MGWSEVTSLPNQAISATAATAPSQLSFSIGLGCDHWQGHLANVCLCRNDSEERKEGEKAGEGLQ